jgi:hypothetical protein
MQRTHTIRFCLSAVALFGLIAGIACNKSASSSASDAGADSKISITTKSDEAKQEYVTGRDLSERLLGQESLAHFAKAVALDPDFASAELALAITLPPPRNSSSTSTRPWPSLARFPTAKSYKSWPPKPAQMEI